jgi:hypothetical protein
MKCGFTVTSVYTERTSLPLKPSFAAPESKLFRLWNFSTAETKLLHL